MPTEEELHPLIVAAATSRSFAETREEEVLGGQSGEVERAFCHNFFSTSEDERRTSSKSA